MAVTPEKAMERAIALAACGFPAPNPRVGCVIVVDGQIVGEGFHEFAGGPHAEIVALDEAGLQAAGATVYVTLEPCNHHGRTPPCSEALIRAGVAKVVFALADPNATAAGGAKRLREAGIEIEIGLLSLEAESVNSTWLLAQRLARPYVNLKAAISLDGRIAFASGKSKWITGEAARREGHRRRAEMGCVLVGAGTVIADDPELTARLDGVRNQPLRVVLDPRVRLKGDERVLSDPSKTLWLRGDDALNVPTVLARLYALGQTGVLVEGGAWTLSQFMGSGMWDRLDLFVAPKLLGNGPAWVNLGGDEGLRLPVTSVTPVGDDLHLVIQNPNAVGPVPGKQ